VAMGAVATTLNGNLGADAANAELTSLANTAQPAAGISASTKDVAVRLKGSLCTKEGFRELQQLFRSMGADLDDRISAAEWGQVVSQDDDIRMKYFGDATADEIAEQFDSLDEDRKSQMAFEQFVDGAMSLGVAIAIAGALASEDGEAELRDLWNSLEHDEHGRVPIDDWAAVLQLHPELLAHYTGLDARISPRFEAFFITGKVNTWLLQCFRRLGFGEKDEVTWEELRLGGERSMGGDARDDAVDDACAP